MLRFQLDTTGNLMKDLIAFWPLDEPGGQRRDLLGYNPLTDNATVTSAKGIGGQGTAGQFTRANSEYLSVSDNPHVSVGNIDFTFTLWTYLDSKPAGDMGIIVKWASGGAAADAEYAIIYKNATLRFRFTVGDGTNVTTVDAADPGEPTTGRWYFIACWHDATADTTNIQVDNGRFSSASHTTGVKNGTATLTIGRDSDTAANYFDGRVTLVGLWKRLLSQQERTDLYNFGRGNRLIAY